MNDFLRKIFLAVAVVLIVGLIVFLSNPLEQAQTVFPDIPKGNTGGFSGNQFPPAPEIIGIQDWINSSELNLAGLRGKVVLVDFWTYSCINCIRTLPYLKEWHKKYSGMGFVLLGVHSPEFEFEKVLENVQRAVTDNGITYPVALDNEMRTWRNYKNRFWPAKYLIDADGRIRYTHFGEGRYEETERQIQLLLKEAGSQKTEIEITPEILKEGVPGLFRTREIYAGYSREGYVGNTEKVLPEQVNEFSDPKNHLDGLFYLQGQWFNSAEFARHARKTENLEDYIAINYLAAEVNIVVSAGKEPYKIFVFLDDGKMPENYAGKDLQFDGQGNAFVEVTQNRLYNIIKGPADKRELKLSSNSDEFALYTFTFG